MNALVKMIRAIGITLAVVVGVILVAFYLDNREPSKMEHLVDAAADNLAQANELTEPHQRVDWKAMLEEMQTRAATVHSYAIEVRDAQKYTWLWIVGAFLVGLAARGGKNEERNT
jgi:hypothetical protein